MSERARAAEPEALAAVDEAAAEPPRASASSSLEEYLAPAVAAPPVTSGLQSAELLRVMDHTVELRIRGEEPSLARIDEALDVRLLELALTNRDRVLVEAAAGERWVVGVLQVRVPKRLELRAREVVIEADEELSLRSGSAGARLRRDGDVEIVGSRISAASRGLFKLVGRVLRLN
ncbi:MAG: hypothetical protein KIT72_02285 [Polyangiaceae bacterium]|nr:hypothetical protein [Polyangiaceae bacterium]MCW5789226.1 hypothetical protein [Polyangiaceae bacterium]